MIVDFTIENFRSIRDEQTFSLYAETPSKHLTENISYPGKDKIGVLKSAGLYGANASGKSNVLLAFEALRYLICKSASLKEGELISCYEPFLLSKKTTLAPTCFEIEFFISNVRYRYKVAFISKRIIAESLIFYPSIQPASIFERKETDSWKTIKFGSLYKGGKKRFPFFDNNAYLSKSGNDASAPEMIRNVYNYFKNRILRLGVNQHAIMLGWFEELYLINKISTLLSLVDTGISRIDIREKTGIDSLELPDEISTDLKQAILKSNKYEIVFCHQTDSGQVEYFNEKKESAGTLKLFHLAPFIINILQNGGLLIVDELDNSMHPFMAELIIKLFNDTRANKSNAQLIFSTHNINLMSSEYLRRDQIWFTEKRQGVTTCYSLDDFDKQKVKPQSPFMQWYAEGRFGAVPAIDYQGILDLLATAREDRNAKEK